jgi:rubrerythrin
MEGSLMAIELKQTKKTKALPQLILGKLEGECNDVMAEYAEDLNHVTKVCHILTALVYQQKSMVKELEEIRLQVEMQLAEQYAGDKVKWGNEQARKATLSQALLEATMYANCLAALEKLEREIADTRDEIAHYEDMQSARRWWARFYVAQALEKSGTGPEGMGFE